MKYSQAVRKAIRLCVGESREQRERLETDILIVEREGARMQGT